MSDGSKPDLADIAATIGQPARAAMLAALLGGQWLTAKELARRSAVAPSTATEHLSKLVEAGIVRRRRSGRHRYHALAGPEVAAALEALERLRPVSPPHVGPSDPAERALRFARTCYDHLAGTLGVAVADALVERRLLSPSGSEVTADGEAWLGDLGVDVPALKRARRTYVTFCLDWSERRDHVAGAVGAALVEQFLARGWIERLPGTRAVRLTLRGREGLYRTLRVETVERPPTRAVPTTLPASPAPPAGISGAAPRS